MTLMLTPAAKVVDGIRFGGGKHDCHTVLRAGRVLA
jgi:hypothetical protein